MEGNTASDGSVENSVMFVGKDTLLCAGCGISHEGCNMVEFCYKTISPCCHVRAVVDTKFCGVCADRIRSYVHPFKTMPPKYNQFGERVYYRSCDVCLDVVLLDSTVLRKCECISRIDGVISVDHYDVCHKCDIVWKKWWI